MRSLNGQDLIDLVNVTEGRNILSQYVDAQLEYIRKHRTRSYWQEDEPDKYYNIILYGEFTTEGIPSSDLKELDNLGWTETCFNKTYYWGYSLDD